MQRASIRAVSRALLAVRYLTIVPVSRRGHAGLEDLGAAAPWFPVVGAALGLVLAVVDGVTTRVFPPLLAALLTITVWKLLTGGLHLDGLADCLDGLAGRDPAERRAIMTDSRIGAFGAIGLIFFLMLELAAVSELPHAQRWRALLAAAVIARATPALLGRLFRPARAGGQGALFAAGLASTAAPAALGIALIVAVVVLVELFLFAGFHHDRWHKALRPRRDPQTDRGEGLVIRCDGHGYYAWLRSLLLDGDWSFDNEFDEHNPLGDYVTPREPRTPRGLRPNQWSVGPACVWAVTVVPGHFCLRACADRGFPWPADGYSLPYQLLVGCTTLLASFAGLGFLWLTAFAVFASAATGVLQRPGVKRALDSLTGLVLVGLGLRLATESRS